MPALYAASVADVLALNALLESLPDLQRDSIERAIALRVEEGPEEGDSLEDRIENAKDELRDDFETAYAAVWTSIEEVRELVEDLPHNKAAAVLAALEKIPAELKIAA